MKDDVMGGDRSAAVRCLGGVRVVVNGGRSMEHCTAEIAQRRMALGTCCLQLMNFRPRLHQLSYEFVDELLLSEALGSPLLDEVQDKWRGLDALWMNGPEVDPSRFAHLLLA